MRRPIDDLEGVQANKLRRSALARSNRRLNSLPRPVQIVAKRATLQHAQRRCNAAPVLAFNEVCVQRKAPAFSSCRQFERTALAQSAHLNFVQPATASALSSARSLAAAAARSRTAPGARTRFQQWPPHSAESLSASFRRRYNRSHPGRARSHAFSRVEADAVQRSPPPDQQPCTAYAPVQRKRHLLAEPSVARRRTPCSRSLAAPCLKCNTDLTSPPSR